MKSPGVEVFERPTRGQAERPADLLPHPASMPGDLQSGLGPVPARTGDMLHIDAALEDKANNDRAYGEFVAAVTSVCASEATGALGITGCRLDEKRDPESHDWLKMVLHVDFADGDFDSKRGRRIKLRKLLNERIRRTRLASCAPEGIDEIIGRFFVTVSW